MCVLEDNSHWIVCRWNPDNTRQLEMLHVSYHRFKSTCVNNCNI